MSAPDERASLPTRLREARDATGLSQAAVAELAGIGSPVSVSQYETGVRTPSVPTLAALARALGVSMDWLTDHETGA